MMQSSNFPGAYQGCGHDGPCNCSREAEEEANAKESNRVDEGFCCACQNDMTIMEGNIARAVAIKKMQIIHALTEEFGVDGGPALVVVMQNEDGMTSQHPALDLISKIIKKRV